MLKHEQDTATGFPIEQKLLWLLGELMSELTTATNLAALQRLLARKLRWIIDFEQCTLAVWSKPSDREYLLFDITSPSKADSATPQKIPLDQGWPGKAIVESKPYFLADLTQLPSSVIVPANPVLDTESKARSLMLLPLRVGERTVGSLNFSSKTPGAYSIYWRNVASLLASQVAGQLGSVIAHEQTSLALKKLAKAQAQLKSACRFRERVMESLNEALYTLDLEGKFKLVNWRTAEISGYSVEALLGFPFLELFSHSEATQIQKHLLEIISNGVPLNQYDTELIKRDGSQVDITFSLTPLFVEGEISAVVGIARHNMKRQKTGKS
jgi:PAS domain S-box-containing protein